jgi:ubiquinone/menaquinone biosynthesis C-methylase UbiE
MLGEYRSVTHEFDRLFDEGYFDLYSPRQDDEAAQEEALAAARLAGCEPGHHVLDCPCGFGRHSLPLARAGYRVVGADRSRPLLEEARRASAGFELDFVEADYRELPFEDDRFDCVLNLFSALGYTGKEGDSRALAEFRRVLRPGGALVVETMHRDRLARIFQPRTWDRLPDGVLIEEREFDQAEAVVRARMIHIPDSGGRREYPYAMRIYTASELTELARAAGFEQVECYGGYEGEELTLDARLVLLAR